jgi:hypothetical protein
MGLQSAFACIVFGWLAPLLRDRGLDPADAGLVVSICILAQAVGCLLGFPIALRARPACLECGGRGCVGWRMPRHFICSASDRMVLGDPHWSVPRRGLFVGDHRDCPAVRRPVRRDQPFRHVANTRLHSCKLRSSVGWAAPRLDGLVEQRWPRRRPDTWPVARGMSEPPSFS